LSQASEQIMDKSLTNYEKGLALELKLTELFKKMGYDSIHNIKKVGRSGAEHQIDVLAEYRCPLHTSKVIVEAKSYDKPIDKDRIMKLIQIVDDLGADRGIIVTTSYFTPEAIKTASGHNVELWSREQLAKLLGEIEISASEKGLPTEVSVKEHVAKFNLSIQEAERIERETLAQRAKGGFLRTAKIIETLDSISLQYLPFYEVQVEASVFEEEKTGLRSKRTVQKRVTANVNFDAQNGDIATISEEGISFPFSYLKNLEEEEIQVLKVMKEDGWYGPKEVTGIGISEGKARKILSRLSTVGAVKVGSGNRGAIVYRPSTDFPRDPRLLGSISNRLPIQEISKTEATLISPEISASDIIKRIASYWNAEVKKVSMLYYPFYICSLMTQDGSKRTDLIDAISGKLREL
jgi:hypothetical protein